jgi:hypothetical protein
VQSTTTKRRFRQRNDSARGEFDRQFVADVSPTQEVKL